MSRKAIFDESTVTRAEEIVREAKTARELRRGLSVALSASCGIPNRRIADVLGIGIATVNRLQKEIRDEVTGKTPEKKPWGGRRRQTMLEEEEKAFLKQWEEQAEQGGVLAVPPIHAAIEKKVGHRVAASTAYRMLARHGWRRLAPDTCHPKRDAEAQENFKKRASEKVWRKL